MNVDPVVFEVIVDYLNNTGFMGKLRSRNPLERLIGGSDMMLRLAKAWHIADMLDLMSLQNKLVDTYRALYLRLLNSRTRMPLDREPFLYLAAHVATFSKIETFMIDFYAGLGRNRGELRVDELQALPEDIAREIKYRRARLAVQGNIGDRIVIGSDCFKVRKLNDNKYTTLHVVAPIAVTASAVPPGDSVVSSPAPRTRRRWSISSLTTLLSPSSSKSPSSPTSSPSTTLGRNIGHRARMSLPGITSTSGDPEVMVARALAPILESAFSNRPTATRSVSMMTMLPSRAPFAHYVPVTPRRQREMDADSDSSEPEEYLFPPRLPQPYGPLQDQLAAEENEQRVAGVH
jgi:hypothetical protein